MNNFAKKVLLLIIFVLSIIFFYNTINWFKWYNKKSFEFAVDLDGFLGQNVSLEQLVEKFKKIGIKKFFINVNIVHSQHLPNNINKSLILKVFTNQKYDLKDLDNFIRINLDKIFSLYLENRKEILLNSLFYQPQQNDTKKLIEDDILDIIKKYKLAKLNFEDNYTKSVIYKPSFRSFLLNLDDIKSYPYEYAKKTLLIKLKKAIFERSCGLIYIIPSSFFTNDMNFELIKSMVSNFKTYNVEMSPYFFETIYFKKVSNFIGILLSILTPIFIFKFYYKKINMLSPTNIFFALNIYTILFGIIIWGFLQRYEFISLEDRIYGIKISFILPILVLPFFILSKEEIKDLLNYNLKIKHMIGFLITFFLLLYVLVRTGNVDKKFLFPYEIDVRNLIETYILFRPRFKEVFFAQPILFLSLNFLKKNPNFVWVKLLYSFSIISSVSVVNTFLHVHTPIWFCIGRSLLGVVLGFLFGNFYLFLIKNYKM